MNQFRDSNATIDGAYANPRFSIESSNTVHVSHANPRFSVESANTYRQRYHDPRFSIESASTLRQIYGDARFSTTSIATDRHNDQPRLSTISTSTVRQHHAHPSHETYLHSGSVLSAPDDMSVRASFIPFDEEEDSYPSDGERRGASHVWKPQVLPAARGGDRGEFERSIHDGTDQPRSGSLKQVRLSPSLSITRRQSHSTNAEPQNFDLPKLEYGPEKSSFGQLLPSATHLTVTPSVDMLTKGNLLSLDEEIEKGPIVLFTAASLYEFSIDRARKEAGFQYLTHVAGEVFDIMATRGELWLARNQDDPEKEIGWIWHKHFAKLAE